MEGASDSDRRSREQRTVRRPGADTAKSSLRYISDYLDFLNFKATLQAGKSAGQDP